MHKPKGKFWKFRNSPFNIFILENIQYIGIVYRHKSPFRKVEPGEDGMPLVEAGGVGGISAGGGGTSALCRTTSCVDDPQVDFRWSTEATTLNTGYSRKVVFFRCHCNPSFAHILMQEISKAHNSDANRLVIFWTTNSSQALAREMLQNC